MLKLIARTMAILAVAGALTFATNAIVSAGYTGGRFGGEHEEHEHRERDFDPNSLTARYPALGVAAGLMPTVIKLAALGVVVVQGRNRLPRAAKKPPRPTAS